jgi:hypothetical protein
MIWVAYAVRLLMGVFGCGQHSIPHQFRASQARHAG